jgi:hypothetical protein
MGVPYSLEEKFKGMQGQNLGKPKEPENLKVYF